MSKFIDQASITALETVASELKAKGGMADIEIANRFSCRPISEVAAKLNISGEQVEPYGHNKAKINLKNVTPKGKLILVTAINPTAAGEGKTTTSIGLTDAMALLNKKVCVALREPSLGPVFGVKGGAAGGGLSQVIPMEDINLHFTGDLHAITTANNFLASLIDNHMHQGNLLKINPKKVMWKRCIDLNERALRNIAIGLGSAIDGVVREDGFNITAASEVMATLCLAKDIDDLKARLGNITVAYNYDNQPVYARELKAADAMAILLKEAVKPNLVQTLIGTPALIHGGPFANIAHGCNSLIATKTALSLADYVVTEAGFGADLGAEKFLDVKCRVGELTPSAVVIVATVRALKLHGGVSKTELKTANVEAVRKGVVNLTKHVENITNNFKLPAVVAINQFITDTAEEIAVIVDSCNKLGVKVVPVEVWAKGGQGAIELANEVIALADKKTPQINYAYELTDSIVEKITKVATKIYGAKNVVINSKTLAEIKKITELGYANLPIIIAKTQYSLSDDATLLGRPEGFTLNIREVQLRSGSGFIVCIAGDVMLMPGLPKTPASDNMTLNSDGSIGGLF